MDLEPIDDTSEEMRLGAVEGQDSHGIGAGIPLIQVGRRDRAKNSHGYSRRRAAAQERYTTSHLLFDLFCVAWVIPIGFALYFGFTNMIVGAGIGCRIPWRPESCFPDLLGVHDEGHHRRIQDLNRHDRAWQGGLQFVAKIIEVWFAIIATSVVFSLTMYLATSSHGLPLAYLLTHASLPDLPVLLETTFWTSCRVPGRGSRKLGMFGFLVLVVLLCIACNLIGPATAILIIPQLVWRTLPMSATERFERIAADRPPELKRYRCAEADIDVGNFSCTSRYSSSLDELSSGYNLRAHFRASVWEELPVITEDFGLLFTVNTTTYRNRTDPNTPNEWIDWVPLRQTLKQLEGDYVEFPASQGRWKPAETSKWLGTVERGSNHDLFDKYQNALDVILHRKGPTLGLNTLCSRAHIQDYFVSSTKIVRCYQRDWQTDIQDVVCHSLGPGWGNADVVHSRFSIQDLNGLPPGDVFVDIYSGSKILVMKSLNASCGQPDGVCDWERLFSLPDGEDNSGVLVGSAPMHLVEYNKEQPSGTNTTALCFTTAYLGFADYFLSVSPDRNFATLVQLQPPSYEDKTVIAFHPDWILAAWSIEEPSKPVNGTRPAAVNLASAFRDLGPPPHPEDGADVALWRLSSLHAVSVIHAMTFVDYNYTEVTANMVDDDKNRPVLTVWKSLRVWAYESQSRTFKAAATVGLFGCLVALLRPLAGMRVAVKRPSSLRFLVAALQRQPLEKLEGLHRERDMGRVLVRITLQEEDGEMAILRGEGEGEGLY